MIPGKTKCNPRSKPKFTIPFVTKINELSVVIPLIYNLRTAIKHISKQSMV